MSMRLLAGLISLASAINCFGQIEPIGCLSYEPALVALHGTLAREIFAGPPNYQDTRKGDKTETSWFVDLDVPICVNEDKSEPDLNPTQKNIRRVQLVLRGGGDDRYKALLGRKVVASGTLFGAHTGHHHTAVLLTVNSIEKAH
jgi:Domain of unknown function (DUF4431)